MSKKRWKQPNEVLWNFVLMAGFFLMSGGQNFAILLISLAIQWAAIYKLGGIDLEEECNSGIHFYRRGGMDQWGKAGQQSRHWRRRNL